MYAVFTNNTGREITMVTTSSSGPLSYTIANGAKSASISVTNKGYYVTYS